ncbi:hypothetical protein VL20_5139 [Microcystis panniformis FACHB-1757]|uniref:Uncharacterized protein n=1 Tax=Microcystis panniformis FACHB-1757 TaxID=1638788 RepID=A0A0K1S775_9CHRO|nr:hypothetical protein VL20_5139 [Microcystis panniformis FACHB-1757]
MPPLDFSTRYSPLRGMKSDQNINDPERSRRVNPRASV